MDTTPRASTVCRSLPCLDSNYVFRWRIAGNENPFGVDSLHGDLHQFDCFQPVSATESSKTGVRLKAILKFSNEDGERGVLRIIS